MIRFDQLNQQLQHSLATVYLLGGDEPLFIQEGVGLIRQKAREAGFTERHVFTVTASFSWQSILDSAQSLSLFQTKKIIELRMPTGKPGDAGSKMLQRYCDTQPSDSILIITTGKLDSNQQKSKWVKAIEKAGTAVQIWPLDKRQLPQWLMQRLKAYGLTTERDGVALLADRTQGNLLAASQAIEKLYLTHGQKHISVNDIANTISDSSRFDIFELADTALSGNTQQTLRILHELKAEGVEPILVLWVFAREIRLLAQLSLGREQGADFNQLCQKNRIWAKRKPIIQTAMKRYSAKQWQTLLTRGFNIDCIIKGIKPGNVWNELVDLGLAIAGVVTTNAHL